MRKVALFLALSLMGCTAEQANLAQVDACWIQSAANASTKLAGEVGPVAEAATVLSTAAGVECTNPVPAQVVK